MKIRPKIALYEPDIPQNTAAIIRLCSCFGATLEIIEPCGFHLNDKRLKRVAMDYLNISKIIQGSQVKIIKKGKHLCNIECSENFNLAVKEFIDKNA